MQANHGRAYGEDSDEFGGHGRLLWCAGLLDPSARVAVNGRMSLWKQWSIASEWLVVGGVSDRRRLA